MSIPATALPISEETPSGHTRNVLIVDDDEAFRYLCVRAVENGSEGNYRAIEAGTAAEAIDLVIQRHVDCALIDYNLPDANGATLMNEIRSAAPNWTGAMVVMTAGGSEIIATEAIRAGAVDYITKNSISPQSLNRALGNAIEKIDLQNSISKRNAELADAYYQLQKRTDEIGRFYHRVSHEIKTPLTAIRMFMSMLHEQLAGPLNDEQVAIVAQSMKSCDELSTQFNDLVECTRLETGKLPLHMSTEPLETVLARAAASIIPAVEAKSLSLEQEIADDLPAVVMDSGRIVQVVANILGNAVKFTESGGTIRLSAHVSQNYEGFVEIVIADSGVGIEAAHLENIFDRLYQVNDVGDDLMGAGLGLGLTIAKEIVELHRGTLSVSSEVGKGTTFTVCLPVD